MVFTVFGATGGLGRQVVEAALERGHSVRAHARSPSKLAIDHDRLEVVQGDLADAATILEAAAGADAVVSCVGHASGEDPASYGAGMQRILDAMSAHGVGRLVSISGAGLDLEGDEGGLGRWLIIALLKGFAGKVLAGKQHEWEAIRRSSVEWTLVRVARMVDRDPSGSVAVDLRRVSGRPVVAYADVAAWMVEEAETGRFVGQAPFVSGG